jgi:hypothetical protein
MQSHKKKPSQDSNQIASKYKSKVKPLHRLASSEDMENIHIPEHLHDSYHNYTSILNISLSDEYIMI